MRWNTGSSAKPTGTKSAQPTIPPPNDTFRITISANSSRLCRLTRGVSPSAAPSAMPAATWPACPPNAAS